MQLCIQSRGIELTEPIKRQVYEKLELALDLLEDQIISIHVSLEDINGPDEGGIDKACRITVVIKSQDSLIMEDCDASVTEVIERVTDRLGVSASQRFESMHGRKREANGHTA